MKPVGKLFTRSTRFTYVYTAQTSTFVSSNPSAREARGPPGELRRELRGRGEGAPAGEGEAAEACGELRDAVQDRRHRHGVRRCRRSSAFLLLLCQILQHQISQKCPIVCLELSATYNDIWCDLWRKL